MNLEPLKAFVEEHNLQVQPAYSLLDIMAELGELSKELLKATNYGRSAGEPPRERMADEIGDVMFAIAYLSTLYDVDPEEAMWNSVRKFEKRLRRGGAGSENEAG